MLFFDPNDTSIELARLRIRAFVSPIIFFIGMPANILVVAVFCREAEKTRTTVYLIATAFADMLALILHALTNDWMQAGLYYTTNHSVSLSGVSLGVCKSKEYIMNASYILVLTLLLCYSLDRTYSAYKNDEQLLSTRKNKAISIGLCLGSLVFSLIVMIPINMAYYISTKPSESVRINPCAIVDFKDPALYGLKVGTCIAVSMFPILTLTILASSIVLTVKAVRIHRDRVILAGGNQKDELIRIIGFLSISATYVIFVFPFNILFFLYVAAYTDDIFIGFSILSSIKDFTYALNFFMYIIFFPKFKYDLKALFTTLITKRGKNYEQNSI